MLTEECHGGNKVRYPARHEEMSMSSLAHMFASNSNSIRRNINDKPLSKEQTRDATARVSSLDKGLLSPIEAQFLGKASKVLFKWCLEPERL